MKEMKDVLSHTSPWYPNIEKQMEALSSSFPVISPKATSEDNTHKFWKVCNEN